MYEKNILDAIQILVDNAISKAGFDKTVQGTISKCVDEKNGKYVVIYQDSSFYAYSNDTSQTYSAGTPVYVHIPKNDFTKTKTIVGSVNKLGSDYINKVDSVDKYDIIGNTVLTLNGEQGVCSYLPNGDALILYNKDEENSLIDIDITAANTYISQANYLVFGGKFRTSLEKEQKYKGIYGLGFDLIFADNMTGESVKRTYLVSVNNMTGNPYEYTKASNQKVVFNMDGANFIEIDKIYLFCYDFPNSSSEEKPDDIFVSDITLEAAAALTNDELEGNKLTLITPQGVYFDDTDNDNSQRSIKTEVRIENNLVNENSDMLRYYWFKENYLINTASLKYQRYGGIGWECLNDYDIIEQDSGTPTKLSWVANKSKYFVSKRDVSSKTTEYKCVVIYNDTIVLKKQITVYNYSSEYNISIESDSGVNFSYDNGHPTLTCIVNTPGDYIYSWGLIDTAGTYSDIQQTTQDNTTYHTYLNRYNELQTGLRNGTIYLTTEIQQELIQLRNSLENYNKTIMRVEDNVIYNLKLNMISNFATFVCSVYRETTGGDTVYLGKGKIKITNDLNTDDNSYTLVINHGNQIFKYDGDGNSPASKFLENPQEIYPFSFILYDEKGNEINNDAIDAKNVSWTVPTSNTMINVSAVHGNPTSIDEINQTKTYTEYKELFFEIPSVYNSNNIRNTVQLEIKYKNKIVRGNAEPVFLKEGEAGSNGTGLVCRIIPNLASGNALATYPIVTHNTSLPISSSNPTLNYEPANANVWFKAQLFKDGEEIFNGPVTANSSEGRSVNVRWEMLTNKYDRTHTDASNFNVNATTGVFSYNDLSSSEDIIKNNPANIVKCTLTYDDVEYIATMPIILAKTTSGYRLDVVKDSGFRYVMYSSDGRTPIYSSANPFALKVYETVEGVERDVSIATTTAAAVNYTWFTSGSIWDGSSWEADNNLVEKTYLSSTLERNEKDYSPIDIYNGLTVNNGLRCVITRSGTKLAEILLPIHFYLNRYGNAALNGWDGNHIEINEDGGFILAPQIGAGKKENDNSYTGIFMGEVREAGESESQIGLFGYNHGQKTIVLDTKDGSAKFGASDQGQIVIDPGADTAKLYSDDYQVGYVSPSDMIPAQTKYLSGYSYWRRNGLDNYTLLKSLEDYIEGYYYQGNFYEDRNYSILITPSVNQKYYDKLAKKCYKYTSDNEYQELTNYYKNGDTIKGTDYVWAGGDGLEIDLNDPHIRFGSGKFRVDSDGQVYATGFVNVVELENGDYNIPGMKNFQLEYPVEDVQFETNVKYYPTETITRTISCKCLYKEEITDDYTVNLIDNQGNVITHDTTHNTDTDGISISITKGQDGTAAIAFSVDSSKKIQNVINDYLFRFVYTPTGDTIDKIFGVNLIIRGTSISVNGSYASLQALLDDVDDGVITPSEGDAYVIDGDLYVYTNAGSGGGTLAADWEDVGRFTGESAKQCVISATSEAFKSNDGGATYTPNSITITPYFQNVNYSSWAYSIDGGANFIAIPNPLPTGISMDVASKALTISKNCELFNSSTILVFKCITDGTVDNKVVYDTRTIMKIKDGVNGVDGYSIWTTTTTPTTPNYTFTIANLVGPSGKTPAVGEVIIQSNRYQYTISEVATTTVKADTRVDLKGEDGNKTAIINLYGRFDTTPNKPYSESVTYTFANQTLSSIPTGWSQTVPAVDGDKKLYISSAIAYGSGTTVVVGVNSWSNPVAMAENGSDGESPTFVTCGNEAQTFVCDANGAVVSNTLITIPFAGYIGNDRAVCSVAYGTLPGETGEIVLVSNNPSTKTADGTLVLRVNATATLGNVTNGDIELTFTCNSKTFIKKFNWAKSLTGTTGYNTATVNLYKRALTSTSIGIPYTSSVNYNFATQELSQAPLNNWSQSIPEGTDPLYITSAIAYSNTGTDGIATTDWSTPSKILQNGTDGGNTATVTLYQRSASAPNVPNETVTYTFADQSLTPSTALGNWSQTIPNGSNPLYVTSAIVFSNEASVRIVSTKWSTPTILVENGLDGKSIVVDTTSVQYRNSDSGTTIPSGNWSDIPSPVAGQYLWTKTTTTYKLAGTSTSAGSSVSYSVAYTGEDGGSGAQGMSVISITPVYYLKTTDGAPQAPTAHVTSVSTGPNQWTTVVPEYDTGATYYTCNEVLYDDNTYGTNGYVWTNVVADMGVNTAITIAKSTEAVVGTYETRIETAEDQIEALSREVIPLSNTVTGAESITLTNPYPGVLHKLSIYGEMSLTYPSSSDVIYGYPFVPGSNLTCGNILPSQPAPYRNSKLYPSLNTYTATLALLVNDVEYNIDINFLNYLSSETYDEFVCEEERSYIIRRVGVDEQGNKYKLTVESIEERQHVPIKVEGQTTIALKSFSNMTYSAEYLINNIYTDTFTTNWELISRINMSPEQIEISSSKINMNGWISANKNFWIDTEGNMGARNGTFSGNVFLPDGGRVIGGDGLLTNLQYTSVGSVNGWNLLGYGVGYGYGSSATFYYNSVIIDCFIPENFTIIEAYLTLDTMPVKTWNTNNVQIVGKPRNLKLYKNTNVGGSFTYAYGVGSDYWYENGYMNLSEVTNAFGSNTYTPSSTTPGIINSKTTDNLEPLDILKTGERNQLVVRTSEGLPGSGDVTSAVTLTGLGKAVLNIIGYMSREDDEEESNE